MLSNVHIKRKERCQGILQYTYIAFGLIAVRSYVENILVKHLFNRCHGMQRFGIDVMFSTSSIYPLVVLPFRFFSADEQNANMRVLSMAVVVCLVNISVACVCG